MRVEEVETISKGFKDLSNENQLTQWENNQLLTIEELKK